MTRRVVVTGIGIVSSIGIGKDTFWKELISGTSGISKITAIDTSTFKCHFGGEVRNFHPQQFIPPRKVKFLGKTSQLAIAAASLAIDDAGIPIKILSQKDTGVIVGTTVGERPMEELINAWAKSGISGVERNKIFQASANTISANVGIQFKTKGFNAVFPTACAAGNYSIGYGYDLIRQGDLDFVLAGGAEAFSHIAFAGFQRLYAMSLDKCHPFDKNRKGMLLGEGAGILFLESLDSALKRKAAIYAEVLGYGLSCDAHHVTAPHPQGVGKCMQNALDNAKVSYEQIDYICAHGTGTPMNDKVECQAIREVFKEHTKDIPVSSIKSMLGHTMGAASAIESGACCLAIRDGIIPPTINFQTPDPECDIDCVPNKARKANLKVVLNNGFAFGGNNCCVVFADTDARR